MGNKHASTPPPSSVYSPISSPHFPHVDAPKPPKDLDLAHMFAQHTNTQKAHPLLSVPKSIPYGTYASNSCVLLDDTTLAMYDTDKYLLSVYDITGDTKTLVSRAVNDQTIKYMNPVFNEPELVIMGDNSSAMLFNWKKFKCEKVIEGSHVYSAAEKLLFVSYGSALKLFDVKKNNVVYVIDHPYYDIYYACLGSGRRIVALVYTQGRSRYATFEINGTTIAPVVLSANPVTSTERFVVLNEELAAFPTSSHIQLWNYINGQIYGTFTIKESTSNKPPVLIPVGRDHLIRTYKKRYDDINVNEYVVDLWSWKRDLPPQILYKNRTTTGVCVRSASNNTVMVSMPTDPLNVLVFQVKDGTGDIARKLQSILMREAFADITIFR